MSSFEVLSVLTGPEPCPVVVYVQSPGLQPCRTQKLRQEQPACCQSGQKRNNEALARKDGTSTMDAMTLWGRWGNVESHWSAGPLYSPDL